ncbi:MAG TPA: TonB-dependent receptor, partial [Flavobacteriales bacterium]|nr:TonB-dependent receptor [Flavobacteriales bacterium]
MRQFLAITSLLLAIVAAGQGNLTISGYVKDASTGETMIGANVYARETMTGATTNTYGYYVLNLPPGRYTVVMSYVGYEDHVQEVDLKEDLKLNITAKVKVITAKEFEVVGEKNKNTEGTQMGTVELDVQKLSTLPALLGEVDILKTIQYLPGVQSNGEGNSGFYVRGGGPDQNLILLDNATVYNASHLFGFFSVFNADAVKNIELIKGGMPANYGGRTSSVL